VLNLIAQSASPPRSVSHPAARTSVSSIIESFPNGTVAVPSAVGVLAVGESRSSFLCLRHGSYSLYMRACPALSHLQCSNVCNQLQFQCVVAQSLRCDQRQPVCKRDVVGLTEYVPSTQPTRDCCSESGSGHSPCARIRLTTTATAATRTRLWQHCTHSPGAG
jgi:hypothetical protein